MEGAASVCVVSVGCLVSGLAGWEWDAIGQLEYIRLIAIMQKEDEGEKCKKEWDRR